MFDLRTEWIPKVWHFENYPNAMSRAPFVQYFLNSGIVSLAVMAGNVVFCTLAGYGLAKFRFPGSGLVLLLILSTLMLPLEVTLVPTFLIVHKFEWINTYQGIVAPLLIDAFGVFLMRQSIISIPTDYIEAARIDGAGELRILLQIIVPQCLPALSVLAIFSFRDSWDQFLWPLTVVSIDALAHLSPWVSCSSARNTATRHRADGDRRARNHPGVPAVRDSAAIDQSRVRLQRTEIGSRADWRGVSIASTRGRTERGQDQDCDGASRRGRRAGIRGAGRRLFSRAGSRSRARAIITAIRNSLKALIAGEADFTNAVGAELLLANLRHQGDAVILASAISRSAQQVAARPGINDTRGPARQALGRHRPQRRRRVRHHHGVRPLGLEHREDAEIVVVGNAGARLDLLLDPARVDVAIMHAPETFQAPKRGYHIVEDFGRLDVSFQNSCAASTRRLLKANPDIGLRYVRAFCQAVHRFRSDARVRHPRAAQI